MNTAPKYQEPRTQKVSIKISVDGKVVVNTTRVATHFQFTETNNSNYNNETMRRLNVSVEDINTKPI